MSVHSLHGVGIAGDPSSPVHLLDPRAKLLGLASVTLVAVSTPLRAWPAFVACLVVLTVVASVGRVGPRVLWSRARVVLPLVLFMLLLGGAVAPATYFSQMSAGIPSGGSATSARKRVAADLRSLSWPSVSSHTTSRT